MSRSGCHCSSMARSYNARSSIMSPGGPRRLTAVRRRTQGRRLSPPAHFTGKPDEDKPRPYSVPGPWPPTPDPRLLFDDDCVLGALAGGLADLFPEVLGWRLHARLDVGVAELVECEDFGADLIADLVARAQLRVDSGDHSVTSS